MKPLVESFTSLEVLLHSCVYFLLITCHAFSVCDTTQYNATHARLVKCRTYIQWMAKHIGTVSNIIMKFISSPCYHSAAADGDGYLRSFNTRPP